ncbi:MAG: quinolinate synthase [Phycisphaerales bacterium]|nr:quinolinate synthase [Phycisphaerales bacterium]
MLWQPSLPEHYLKMSPDDLTREIEDRRRRLGDSLVILGHHYQTDEVIQHADFTGDSLKLSQLAAEVARTRPVKHVIFCGVHFMAESADMLTPENVEVILPDLSAGCSMADMAQYDDTCQAWDAIHATLREGGWQGQVIPITYVNSSAAIKAFVGANGGACCTSSNAAMVFDWAMRGGDNNAENMNADERHAALGNAEFSDVNDLRETPPANGEDVNTRAVIDALGSRDDVKILFLPDQHLGRNTAAKHGIDVAHASCVYDPRRARAGEPLGGASAGEILRSRVILWAGHCSVHKLFRPEHCDQVRAEDAQHPDREPTRILVHPECAKEVVDKADLAGSTEFIISTIRSAPPGSRWAVGTEVHLVTRIAREAAERGVSVRILSDCQCLCTTMYRIDQPHLLWVLDNLCGVGTKDGTPRVVNAIRVHPEVRSLALKALDRMLGLSPAHVAKD